MDHLVSWWPCRCWCRQDSVRLVGMASNLLLPYLVDDPQLGSLVDRVQVCREMGNCSRILKDADDPLRVALIVSKRTMWFSAPYLFLDERGRSKLRPIRESLFTFHVSTMMAKGSPILIAVNDAVAKAREAGLVSRWMQMLQLSVDREVDYGEQLTQLHCKNYFKIYFKKITLKIIIKN